jgi:hypothetical protein
MGVSLLPSLSQAQFLQGFNEGMMRGQQLAIQKQQLAMQRQQMKFQALGTFRDMRAREFDEELRQWSLSVHELRDALKQPRWTKEEAAAYLDRLRVGEWENMYEQAWLYGDK